MDSTCWNCNDLLSDCKCGDTETYDNEEGPICPHCGYLNKACDSDGMLYSERTEEWDCGDCGKSFGVSVSVSFAWTANRKPEDE